MARATTTKTVSPKSYPTAMTVVTLTAADPTNKQQFQLNGNELLIAFNSGASPHTVTVTSVADRAGRVGHITAQSVAAGAMVVCGPLNASDGWKQTDGMLYFEANHAEVKFAVITI